MDKGLEFSFSWIFAIIVGAVIIFLAVYGATRFVDTGQTEVNAEVGAQLGVLLNPVETGVESGRYLRIDFPEETRMYNDCISQGNFGQQGISASVKSGIGQEWKKPETKSLFYNKYVFSSAVEQGKEMHVFSKPFEFPYKVADMIIISSKDYCFVNPPGEIREEISGLGNQNINLSSSVSECPRDYEIVCFSGSGCDVDVNFDSKTVRKDGVEMQFYDGLVYGAIFSDPGVYECQVKRIMKRNSEIAKIYSEKTLLLSSYGCNSNLQTDLESFSQISENAGSSSLIQLSIISEQIGRKNDALVCPLF